MNTAVTLGDLRYTYPDGRPALNGINLEIQPGESVGMIGPNGAGKTTLLLHLNGILAGTGEVRIFGDAVTRDRLRPVRRKVGVVFQDPDDQLFSATVRDDVAFGPLYMDLPAEEVERRTREALVQVGMEELAAHSPHHLSIGEKRRVSIATILSMKPEILVLDEPTSNLDPRQRKNLIELLARITTTKIIASHDLDLVDQLCERVIFLHAGTVVADGPAAEILRDAELLTANGLEVVPLRGHGGAGANLTRFAPGSSATAGRAGHLGSGAGPRDHPNLQPSPYEALGPPRTKR